MIGPNLEMCVTRGVTLTVHFLRATWRGDHLKKCLWLHGHGPVSL